MSDKSYYQNQKTSWASSQSELNGKAKRLKEALAALKTKIKNFDDNKKDYDRKYKKIDNGSGADDWEGQRVIDIRDQLKSKVTSNYTSIRQQYKDVESKLKDKIVDYTEQAKTAGEKASYYEGLAKKCDDNKKGGKK